MDTAVIILIAVVVVAIAVGAWFYVQSQKRSRLRERFGPEYERVIDLTDDRRAAETELTERAARRDELTVRDLDATAQRSYATRWRQVQAAFVDQPGSAVRDADLLVAEVMRERGYPVEDFETRADLISVDHPALVDNYRESHAIALRHDRNEATTDDLRRAFIHYRALFEELLGATAEPGSDRAGR